MARRQAGAEVSWEVRCCDALEGLRELEAESVDCCVTSPPYWNLRDYGVDGQLGLEPHPSLYLEKLWAIFDEAQRVLKPSGTCWVVLGDTYGTTGGDLNKRDATAINTGQRAVVEKAGMRGGNRTCPRDDAWLRPKQKLLIPARFAIGMQERGWLLRSDIIWAKGNPLPEPVRDRPTRSHEHLFLFVKQAKYWYDAAAIAEAVVQDDYRPKPEIPPPHHQATGNTGLGCGSRGNGVTRNSRDVWTINTQPFPEVHFAVFPPALPQRCIRAGCPAQVCEECGKPWKRVVELGELRDHPDRENRTVAAEQFDADLNAYKDGGTLGKVRERKTVGWQPTCECNGATVPGLVLDPFCGSGTTGQVAVEEGRRFLGFELNPKYVEMSKRRIGGAQAPLPIADLQP